MFVRIQKFSVNLKPTKTNNLMISKLTIFHHKGAVEFSFVLCTLSGKHATNQLLILKLCGADLF